MISKDIKAFYAAWLRELGHKAWEDDPQQIETAILTKHIRPQQRNTQNASKKRIYQILFREALVLQFVSAQIMLAYLCDLLVKR